MSQFTPPMKSTYVNQLMLLLILLLLIPSSRAQFNPAKVNADPTAVAARFPAPNVRYDTPGFKAGRTDFASHAEVLDYLNQMIRKFPQHARLEVLGQSQRGLDIPAVILTATGKIDATVPTVLIIGQQHGNEPAGGEAALVIVQRLVSSQSVWLKKMNVVVIPRGNPDGAEGFMRTTANGMDVNRDHLLLNTPEGRGLALATLKYKPHVALDLHEFTVGGRWIEKFGGVMKYDALLQAATVGNLNTTIDEVASRVFVNRIGATLAHNGLTTFDYHTTAAGNLADKTVSMGGVQPDTGRNVGGLRPAVSLLIEVRGVGIGRQHFERRVNTLVLAAQSVLETTAAMGHQLTELVQKAGATASQNACQGDLVIEAQHTPVQKTLTLLDPKTGADLPVEVDWRAASPLQVVRSRPRPCGYLIDGNENSTLERLRLLGVELHVVNQASRWVAQRYVVVSEDDGARQDARGAIEDGQAIKKFEVKLEQESVVVAPGMVYVSLTQPLSALITAALEPDSQNSYAANRILDLKSSRLMRVVVPPGETHLSQLR